MKLPLFALAFILSALFGTSAVAAEPPKVLFEDHFAGKLGEGWQWIRERPEHWRIADGSLIIDTLPGSYWLKENSGQNTLLRKPPASLEEGFTIEVHLDKSPKGQWEHAGSRETNTSSISASRSHTDTPPKRTTPASSSFRMPPRYNTADFTCPARNRATATATVERSSFPCPALM